jgi:putative DNA methylase
VLEKARAEIWQSWRRACADNVDHPRVKELFDRSKLPAFHDPFSGGGALPLEAQRLGLEAYASDLNPVAVLICKAMIEIPPKFAGRPPVNPQAGGEKTLAERQWKGAQGLAEDVRYYGQWMRDEAEKRIGHLYPKVEITAEMAKGRPDLKPLVGQKLTVIAWVWARTVKSPNPAFRHVDVPLATSFRLSTKANKEARIEPVLEESSYRFTVKVDKARDEAAKNGTKLGSSGSSFRCLMSDTPIPFDYIRTEGKAGRIGARLMAIVAEGERGRLYLSPTDEIETIAQRTQPPDLPETNLPDKALGFRLQEYGMTKWRDLFTSRQLIAMTTFSELVQEARERVRRDALAAALPDDGKPLTAGGTGAAGYADSVAVYLAFIVEKLAESHSTICTWSASPKNELVVSTFRRHALPMTWDFAEANPFADSSGSLNKISEAVARVVMTALSAAGASQAYQADAASEGSAQGKVVSTDPPYYDNIGYADLSDFFYFWLRRSLKPVFPDLFVTLTVPKADELVATPYRHGTREKADAFFLDGMTRALHRLAEQVHPAFPVTVYYAFKQSEGETHEESGTASTGWETFLDAVIRAGFAITGTWPIRTEREGRSIGIRTNALASSIILVCRSHAAAASTVTRREFTTALKAELPPAVTHLKHGNIAPVDLAQAAIGPGMAIYTRYAQVMDAAGKPLTVREALALINETLDEVLAEQEGDFDAGSRWAVAWFEQQGFAEGEFGVAETLSKAKNTSIDGMVEAGILSSKRGKVRLLKPEELLKDWDPANDPRLTAWEMVHQLIRALEAGGESAAALLVAKLGSKAEIARELAYRLYTIAERKKRPPEALSYNALVQSWPEIRRLARAEATPTEPAQAALL